MAARPPARPAPPTQHGDAWFIGFTPQLTTAVWMGSPESVVPMNNVGGINVFGGTFPALVWHNFMVQAMAGLPVERVHATRSPTAEQVPAASRPRIRTTSPSGRGRTIDRRDRRRRAPVPTDAAPTPPGAHRWNRQPDPGGGRRARQRQGRRSMTVRRRSMRCSRSKLSTPSPTSLRHRREHLPERVELADRASDSSRTSRRVPARCKSERDAIAVIGEAARGRDRARVRQGEGGRPDASTRGPSTFLAS